MPQFRRTVSSSWVSALVAVILLPGGLVGQTGGGDRVRTLVGSLPGGVGGITVDRLGFVYVADFRETVWKITPSGQATIFVTGLYGASGNAIDSKGNLLQSSCSGHYVSRIDRHGNQQILAAGLAGPVGLAVDPDDNLFVCNCQGNTISRITPDGEVPRP